MNNNSDAIHNVGTVPEDWAVVPLGNLMNVVYRYPTYYKISYQEEGVPEVRGELLLPNGEIDTTSVRFISEETAKRFSKTCLLSGDLVISVRGTMGKVGIVRHSLAGANITANLMRLSPKREIIDSQFLLFYIISPLFNKRLNDLSPQTTIKTIQAPILKSISIPLPPLPEQKAIAHVLSTVRQSIEATERVIAAARELKRSLMKYLFTYGPVPIDQADQVVLKETEIGQVPEEWEVTKLGAVIEKPQYGYTETATDKQVGPNFLRITDIQDIGIVNWATVPYCKCSDNDFKKYELKPDDILVARIGATTGKCFIVSERPRAVFASYLIRIRSNASTLSPSFLYHYMNTQQYWQQVNATKGGRLKQGINIPNLQSLILSIPSLPEQVTIADILKNLEEKVQREIQRKSALEALFNSLLHHLMTGKVRVSHLVEEEEG